MGAGRKGSKSTEGARLCQKQPLVQEGLLEMNETNTHLGCIKMSVTIRLREVLSSLICPIEATSQVLCPRLQSPILQIQETTVEIPTESMKMLRGLEHLSG